MFFNEVLAEVAWGIQACLYSFRGPHKTKHRRGAVRFLLKQFLVDD